ncbi:MAG: glycerate kinase [Anaerolineae bacterium]|nr:glycerate kinase [Anaerolineae bacterium]
MNLIKDIGLIRDAALAAVDPGQAVRRFMTWDGDVLQIGDQRWPMDQVARVLLIAGGKAAMPMVATVAHMLGAYLTAGIVVTKYKHAAGYVLPDNIQVFEAGHPIPDAAGVRGTEAIVQLLAGVTAQDRVLILLSGGGSALLPAPAEGISLGDLQTVTDLLLRSGATIDELNVIRKHLSKLKGGQLSRLAAPAPTVALILSDVVGDPLDVIASGPTSPDPTTYEQAWRILERYKLLDAIPPSVKLRLQAGKDGHIGDTPKPDDALFKTVSNVIVGSNRLAAKAAVSRAKDLGYRSLLLTTFIEGEAREVAKVAVALARGVKAYGDPISVPACLVCGGETTVTIRGEGLGGRNQEVALAAALALEGIPDVVMMALATDGTDGPTDAAGAIVDGNTISRARSLGLDPIMALSDNNSYPFLATVGALMITGPTGTNVNDLLIILVK